MRTKATLKILLLFLLGMALGAGLMGGYINYKLHRMHQHGKSEGLKRHILHIVDANDKEAAALEQVLDKYTPQITQREKEFHDSMKAIFQHIKEDGSQVLSGQALGNFQKQMEKMEKGPPHQRRKKRF